MSMGIWYGIGLMVLNGVLCLAIPVWVLRWQHSMAQRQERERRLAQAVHRGQTLIASPGADRLAEVPVEAR